MNLAGGTAWPTKRMRFFEGYRYLCSWGRRFRLPPKDAQLSKKIAAYSSRWHLPVSNLAAVGISPVQTDSFADYDRLLDRSALGPLWLKDSRIAEIVSRAILIGDCERRFYELRAWAVMPNPVHLLILPLVPVPVLMRRLKGSTARVANRILERTGKPFWQDESYDHYLRGSLDRTVSYIEENPVSAGLVGSAESWPCSGAGWQKMAGGTACPTKTK